MTDFTPAEFFALGNQAAQETAKLPERPAPIGADFVRNDDDRDGGEHEGA